MTERSKLIRRSIKEIDKRTEKEVKLSREALERGTFDESRKHRDIAVGLQRQKIRLIHELDVVEGRRSIVELDRPKGVTSMERRR